MILKNELRIGNILNSESGLIRVVGITKEEVIWEPFPHVFDRRLLISDYQPIPITSDRLLMMGFKETEKYLLCEIYAKEIVIALYKPHTLALVVNNKPCPREYRFIHELQNLYYALTGEEITIEMPHPGQTWIF